MDSTATALALWDAWMAYVRRTHPDTSEAGVVYLASANLAAPWGKVPPKA